MNTKVETDKMKSATQNKKKSSIKNKGRRHCSVEFERQRNNEENHGWVQEKSFPDNLEKRIAS